MKILIVEDEEVLADVLDEKFKNAGFSTKIASDGEQALILVKSFKPDVIALDLMLPKVDGFSFLEQIKKDDSYKRIPVVVMSNLSGDEDIKKALMMGAIDYFVKSEHPINEIVEKIKAVLLKSK